MTVQFLANIYFLLWIRVPGATWCWSFLELTSFSHTAPRIRLSEHVVMQPRRMSERECSLWHNTCLDMQMAERACLSNGYTFEIYLSAVFVFKSEAFGLILTIRDEWSTECDSVEDVNVSSSGKKRDQKYLISTFLIHLLASKHKLGVRPLQIFHLMMKSHCLQLVSTVMWCYKLNLQNFRGLYPKNVVIYWS